MSEHEKVVLYHADWQQATGADEAWFTKVKGGWRNDDTGELVAEARVIYGKDEDCPGCKLRDILGDDFDPEILNDRRYCEQVIERGHA